MRVSGINKSFPGVKALDNVNFAVRKGTVHALCGENGAGKSTLMKIIVRRETIEFLRQENLPYKPDQKLKTLTVSDIQMLEIIKAISNNAQIVIMDEPTSAITNREVEVLFGKIAELKKKGVSIIYISHKMEEVFRIADDITVLRDGKTVETHP